MILNNQVPKISVVIPTFNSSSVIDECLEKIFAYKVNEMEVIVVDDCSLDDTVQKVSQYPCTVLKNEINKGPSFSRNRGIKQAQGQIVLLIDSDVLVYPDTIKITLEFFQKNPTISILQGHYDDKPYYKNLFSQYKHYVFSFRGLMDSGKYINYIHTACVAFKKDVFAKVQFNETLTRREDIEFGLNCIKNGYLIYTCPELKVSHKKNYDLISFSKYQLNTAKEIVFQYYALKNKNTTIEFNSKKNSLYKKLWFLRPIISSLMIFILFCFQFMPNVLVLWLFGFLILVSFFLEFQFRIYLFRIAPLYVSVAACFIYFYDGLLLALGALFKILEVITQRKSIKEII